VLRPSGPLQLRVWWDGALSRLTGKESRTAQSRQGEELAQTAGRV
jgi:hypothetical protein